MPEVCVGGDTARRIPSHHQQTIYLLSNVYLTSKAVVFYVDMYLSRTTQRIALSSAATNDCYFITDSFENDFLMNLLNVWSKYVRKLLEIVINIHKTKRCFYVACFL